jgi:nicotinic acid mononucleotide adenylyltransferase
MASLSEDSFIFTIARMNPPTPGHMFLIRTLIYKALEKSVDHVYVFLSKTRNNDKDPLSCPEKEEFLTGVGHTMIESEKQRMIAESKGALKVAVESIQVHVICVPEKQHSGEREPTPVSELIKTVGANPRISELVFIIGEDREKEFGTSVKNIFSKWGSIRSVEVIGLKREGMHELVQSSKANREANREANQSKPTVGSISASYVRNLVKHILSADAKTKDSYSKEFHDLYEPYLDKKRIDQLYQSIVDGFARPDNPKPKAKTMKMKNAEHKESQKKTKTKTRKSSPNHGKSERKPTPYKGGKNTKKHRTRSRYIR